MTLPPEPGTIRARASLLSWVVALVLGPAVAQGAVVSSADLSLSRSNANGEVRWSPAFAFGVRAADLGFGSGPDLLSPERLSEGTLDDPSAQTGRRQRLLLHASQGPSPARGTIGMVRGDLRFESAPRPIGTWFSVGAAGVAGDDQHISLPLLGLGGWARRERFSLMTSLDQVLAYQPPGAPRTLWVPVGHEPDTLITWDSTTEPGDPAQLVNITRLQTQFGFAMRRLGVAAIAGVDVASGVTPLRWLMTYATLDMIPRVQLFASFGSPPRLLYADSNLLDSRASFGARLISASGVGRERSPLTTGGIESWRMKEVGSGLYRFTVGVSGATRVELMGDMTDWQPLDLTRRNASRWETTLAMNPGVHQVVVRVDGRAWTVPPGMNSTPSEYGDIVGVLVVK